MFVNKLMLLYPFGKKCFRVLEDKKFVSPSWGLFSEFLETHARSLGYSTLPLLQWNHLDFKKHSF